MTTDPAEALRAPALPRASVTSSLRRRWWVVVGVGLLLAVVAYLVTPLLPRQYEAQGQIFVDTRGSAAIPAAQNDATGSVSTLAQLLVSDLVLTPVAQARGMQPRDVRAQLTAVPVSGASLIQLTAQADTPAGAVALSNDVVGSYLRLAGRQATSTSAGPEALTSTGIAFYSSPALPSSPVSPRPSYNAVVALLLGLVLGAVLVWLAALLSARVLSSAAALAVARGEKEAELPGRQLGSRGTVLRSSVLSAAALDLIGRHPATRLVVVASTSERDFDPQVVLDLALAHVYTGHSVVLVDGDLVHGELTAHLGERGTPGVLEIMAGRETVADALLACVEEEHLQLLTSGALPGPTPTRSLLEVLNDLLEDHDLVVLAAPELVLNLDDRELMSPADSVVLLTNRHTRTIGLLHLRDRLAAAGRRPALVLYDRGRRGAGHSPWTFQHETDTEGSEDASRPATPADEAAPLTLSAAPAELHPEHPGHLEHPGHPGHPGHAEPADEEEPAFLPLVEVTAGGGMQEHRDDHGPA